MSPDGLPCSGCPLLDLGVKYPVGDERDPWRRMPGVFDAAVRVFGRGMFNHHGRLRLRAEKLLGHYCRVQREMHGPCTRRRSLICQQICANSLTAAGAVPEKDRVAYATGCLRKAPTDERTYVQIKATRVRPATPDLRMPPITFRSVPAA